MPIDVPDIGLGRADALARDAYARMKREAASRYRDDRLAYNEAKTGFILDELDRAREWAVRTGWSMPVGP